MSTDFRIKAGYFSHLKTIKLERRLGSDGVLCHLRLIEYCAINKTDGVFGDMDADDIEIAARWNGESGVLVRTLIELRLIDEMEPGFYAMHDWVDHNPFVAGSEYRSELARNAARSRWDKRRAQTTSAPSGVQQSALLFVAGSNASTCEEEHAEHKTALLHDANGSAGILVAHCSGHDSAMPEDPNRIDSACSPHCAGDDRGLPIACASHCAGHASAMRIDADGNAPSPSPSPIPIPSPNPIPTPTPTPSPKDINTAAAENSAPAREESELSAEETELLRKLTTDFGDRPALERSDALRLLCAPRSDGKSPLAVIRQQLRYWPYRQPGTSPRPFLIKAIAEDWAAPPGWLEAKKRHDDEAEKRREREKVRDESLQRDTDAERQKAEFEAWRANLPAALREQASLRAIAQLSKNPAVKLSIRRCQADGIDLLAHKPISGVYQAALKAAVDAIRGGQK